MGALNGVVTSLSYIMLFPQEMRLVSSAFSSSVSDNLHLPSQCSTSTAQAALRSLRHLPSYSCVGEKCNTLRLL